MTDPATSHDKSPTPAPSTTTTPPGEIVRVPFHGEDILTVDVDGRPHVVLKPSVESIGLDYWTQVEKLRTRSWAVTSQRPATGADGKTYQMVTVDVRTFLMLLATIDERRVAADVRPKLKAYQSEVADAIESYWTGGGAINPRATERQLAAIVDLSQKRLGLLQAAAGLVDPAWLEAKTRHELARGFGEAPDIDPATRPLTVGEYLQSQGVTGAALRSMSAMFGKQVKKRYRTEYGADPLPTERFVDGALRMVAGYTERHRPLFDATWNAMTGGAA